MQQVYSPNLPNDETGSTFESAINASFGRVRARLHECLASAGINPSESQELTRRLGLSRSVGWRFSRVVTVDDPYQAMQHLPSGEGVQILAASFRRISVPGTLVESLVSAYADFETVVQAHIGDRSALELFLDSLAGAGSVDRLEASRKSLFRGGSAVWGMQAKARIALHILAPSRNNPSKVDIGLVGGFIGFRRLRTGVAWPFAQRSIVDATGASIAPAAGVERIGGAVEGDELGLIRGFCTPTMPRIQSQATRAGLSYVFDEGPVGNAGLFDVFSGSVVRAVADRWRTPRETHADISTPCTAPVESLQFDVLLHKSLNFGTTPEVVQIAHAADGQAEWNGYQLPLEDRMTILRGYPLSLATALMPRYEELVFEVLAQVGGSVREFDALRLVQRFPPMHTSIIARFQLPYPP